MLLESNPQTSDVDFGTGLIKSVSPAQPTGSSTKTVSAFLSAINAGHSINKDSVFLAIKVMTLPKELALFQLQTLPDLQISDALFGTGIKKYASLAPNGGSEMPTLMLVSPLAIFAKITIPPLEDVFLAIKDSTSTKVFANPSTSLELSLLMLDAELGIGKIKSASPAQPTGSSSTMFAFL